MTRAVEMEALRSRSELTPHPLTVELIEHREALAALAPEWEALWQRCPEATVFQTPDWLLPWCDHLLRGEVASVALRRGARLVALAPLFRWTDGGERVLSLLGAGVSDVTDLLWEPSERTSVVAALEAWLDRTPGWDRLQLSEVPGRSPLLGIARRRAGPRAVTWQDVCPGVPLPVDEGVDGVLSARARAKLTYERRRARRLGAGEIEEVTPATLEELLAGLETLHTAQWNARGEPGAFADPRVYAFHRAAARRLLDRSRLLLRAMRVHGQLAAVFHGFRDRRRHRYYLGAQHPRHARLGLGTLLIAHALESACHEGADTFDFLRGREAYKYRWGACDLVQLHRAEARRLP